MENKTSEGITGKLFSLSGHVDFLQSPQPSKTAEKSLRARGQSAAAFRAFGQGGAIPAAAECLDKHDRVDHTTAKKIYRSKLVGERGALSSGYFEVAGDTALIAYDGQIQIFPGCLYCFILGLSFVLENPQCRYVIFDLL